MRPRHRVRVHLLRLTAVALAFVALVSVRVVTAQGGSALGAAPTARIEVLPVQGNVYMLVGDGANITASIGPDGILLVDTGLEARSGEVLARLLDLATRLTASGAPNRCLGQHCASTPFGWVSPGLNAIISRPAPPKPVRYIINTSDDDDHVGGNETLAKLPNDSKIVGVTFPPIGVAPGAIVISHERVLLRMSEPAPPRKAAPTAAWPTITYHAPLYKLSQFFNGEGIIITHEPAAYTDGDSIVHFRYSDVISTGEIYATDRYPRFDISRGGSYQGVLDSLNHILDSSVPEFRAQGGTLIVPGHGRLADTGDLANYRNMVAIIRDRLKDMIARGLTLAQVKAARPTMDYDGLYGATTGTWTTDMFIEAAYRSLSQKK